MGSRRSSSCPGAKADHSSQDYCHLAPWSPSRAGAPGLPVVAILSRDDLGSLRECTHSYAGSS